MIYLRETPFRQAVMEVATKAGYHVTHIESPTTSAGVPDLNLFRDVDIWIELKVWATKRGVQMRPTQKLWHMMRHQAGGLSWVLLHHEGKLSLISGMQAARMKFNDPRWLTEYVVGVQADLPRILRDCQRAVMRNMLDKREPLRTPESLARVSVPCALQPFTRT